ncbi:MAG: phosphatase PAP2 family protein [Alphaproteobacteria bacterium]|nr:phosphatase PAP2 family protein [Alphaproteobacteria bacterium]
MFVNPSRWLVLLVLALLVVVTVFPGIDLTVSRWFFTAGAGFTLKELPVLEFIRHGLPPILIGIDAFVAILWLAGIMLKKQFFAIDGRIPAFLLSSLAIGPGLIVNSLLKEHWGRARPSTVIEFGGHLLFTRPLVIAGQCDHNCPFSSGHAPPGYWTVAFAFLAPPRWRPHAFAAALVFGSLVGLSRIIQGGHFLSDVVYAGVVTIAVTWVLYRLILKPHRPL